MLKVYSVEPGFETQFVRLVVLPPLDLVLYQTQHPEMYKALYENGSLENLGGWEQPTSTTETELLTGE